MQTHSQAMEQPLYKLEKKIMDYKDEMESNAYSEKIPINQIELIKDQIKLLDALLYCIGDENLGLLKERVNLFYSNHENVKLQDQVISFIKEVETLVQQAINRRGIKNKPDLNYLWVGAPTKKNPSAIAGHDVLGPIEVARQMRYQTEKGLAPNKINFWCLKEHEEYYKTLFQHENVDIEVKTIEDLLNQEVKSFDLNKEAQLVANQLKSLDKNNIKNVVQFKDLFSLFLLVTQQGYILDTNVRLYPDYHIILETTKHNIVFDYLPRVSAIQSPDLPTKGDFYLLYSPSRNAPEASRIFKDWIEKPAFGNISVIYDIHIIPPSFLSPNFYNGKGNPQGLYKNSFKSYYGNESKEKGLFRFKQANNNVFKKMLAFGDVNQKAQHSHTVSTKKMDFSLIEATLLHYFIIQGDMEKIKILLENRADINIKAKCKIDINNQIEIKEFTPLELANYLQENNFLSREKYQHLKTLVKLNENNLVFMNLTGEPLAFNPKEEIKKQNHPIVRMAEELARLNTHKHLSAHQLERQADLVAMINNANPSQKIDYHAVDSGTLIAMTELWGRRTTQEDRVTAGLLPSLIDLTVEEIENVLKKTPELLQTIIEQNKLGMNQGSTLCCVVIQGNKIYNANIGDSIAFKCIIDSSGKISLIQINTDTHHPETGKLINKKTGTSLSVARAIGDLQFKELGLRHDADFYSDSIKIIPGGKSFVITACDGFMDSRWNMSKQEIEEFIENLYQTNPNITASQLSLDLAQEALKRGSPDNISVMAVEANSEDITPKYMAVFDGHGGDEVSEALSQLQGPVLTNQILLEKLNKINSELATKLENSIKTMLEGKDIQAIKNFYELFNTEIMPIFFHLLQKYLTKNNSGVNIANSNIADSIVKAVEQYCIFVEFSGQPLKAATEYRDLYCGNFKFNFLTHPLKTADELMQRNLLMAKKMLAEGVAAEDIRNLRRATFNSINELEQLYKIASIMLNIRKSYDENMPSSFDKTAFRDYKATVARKNVIEEIEYAVKTTLEHYPKENVATIAKKLLDKLNSTYKITIKDHGVSLFSSGLAEKLMAAIEQVQKIYEKELLSKSESTKHARGGIK